MEDVLLQRFFELPRWEQAIDTAVKKGIHPSLLRKMSGPEERVEIYRAIRDGNYHIAPPHEAQIPKDDGTMRTVYVNEEMDRVLLSIANDLLFESCPEMIHSRCGSYQKGIGCGKLVKEMSIYITAMKQDDIGVKVDLSKYFDSVPRKYIDEIFDHVEDKYGSSALIAMIREYYHMDRVLNLNGQEIEKYSSLRQGCAVAAFLADAVLCDMDDVISSMSDIQYIRYSDDILIIGSGWKPAYARLKNILSEKGLSLNPKKVDFLDKNQWFPFLGFMLKNNQITLSANRVKSFQKEIEKRTIAHPGLSEREAIRRVAEYLYRGNGEYSWATSVLPIMNTKVDILQLDKFVMDAIRACVLGRTKIGGLGIMKNGENGTITRGKGKNVAANRKRMPCIDGWLTIGCMKNAMMASMEAYRTLAMSL